MFLPLPARLSKATVCGAARRNKATAVPPYVRAHWRRYLVRCRCRCRNRSRRVPRHLAQFLVSPAVLCQHRDATDTFPPCFGAPGRARRKSRPVPDRGTRQCRTPSRGENHIDRLLSRSLPSLRLRLRQRQPRRSRDGRPEGVAGSAATGNTPFRCRFTDNESEERSRPNFFKRFLDRPSLEWVLELSFRPGSLRTPIAVRGRCVTRTLHERFMPVA